MSVWTLAQRGKDGGSSKLSSIFHRPWSRCYYGNGRRRYEVRTADGGWFQYFDILKYHKAERLMTTGVWVPESIPESLQPYTYRQKGAKFVQDCAFIDIGDLQGVHLKPWLVDMDYTMTGERSVDYPTTYDPDTTDFPTVPACRYHFDFTVKYWVAATRDTHGHATNGSWVTIPASQKTHADFGTYWDFVKSADGLFVEMIQKLTSHTTYIGSPPVQSTNSPTMTMITCDPTDGLCPNLWWAFGVRRQAAAEDVDEFIENNAIMVNHIGEVSEATSFEDLLCTTLYFGGLRTADNDKVPTDVTYFQWSLRIPLTGKPKLCIGRPTAVNSQTGEWTSWGFTEVKWTGGDLSENTTTSLATDGRTYIVGALGDSLVVFEQGSDTVAYYRVPNVAQPIIPCGPLRAVSYAGQCAMWMAPVHFYLPSKEGIRGQGIFLKSPYYVSPNYSQERVGFGVYGWSLGNWSAESELYVWPSGAPTWWPTTAYWPPKGPPGSWPSTVPIDWPDGTAWPPEYEITTDNPVPPPDDITYTWIRPVPDAVLDTREYVIGGAIYLQHWGLGSATPPQALAWKLTMEQIRYYPTAGSRTKLATYSTPFMQGISLWQTSLITDNGDDAPGYVELPIPHHLSVSRGIGDQGVIDSSYEVITDNREENQGFNAATTVRLGATMRTYMGAVMKDGTINYSHIGDFIVAEKPMARTEAGFVLADVLQMLHLDKWVGGDINFKLWTAKGAIEFLLNYCGIGTAWCELEDLGLILTDESRGGEQWMYRNGTSIAEMIIDIAYRGQMKAAVWCDGFKIMTGCPYCRTARTALTYAAHMNNGWNSSGCRAADVARVGGSGIDRTLIASMQTLTDSLLIVQSIEAEETSLREANFATRVQIEGEDEFGLPVRWLRQNTDAVGTSDAITSAYVGWNITHHQTEENLKSWTDLYSRGLHVWNQLSTKRLDCKRIELPLAVTEDSYMVDAAATLWEGKVVHIIGGRGIGTTGLNYRVVNVVHEVQELKTTLFAKQMIGPYG